MLQSVSPDTWLHFVGDKDPDMATCLTSLKSAALAIMSHIPQQHQGAPLHEKALGDVACHNAVTGMPVWGPEPSIIIHWPQISGWCSYNFSFPRNAGLLDKNTGAVGQQSSHGVHKNPLISVAKSLKHTNVGLYSQEYFSLPGRSNISGH